MSKNSKQQTKSPNRLHAFILEPILTPSGLIDGVGDHTSDLDVGFHSDVLIYDALDDGTSNRLIDGVEGETPGLDTELYPDVLPDGSSTALDDFALDNLEIIPFSVETEYTSGVFTVGDSGQVRIDFLYDGGAYRGQLGIFSLRGLESLDPNSTAFIHEAATRALSNSDFGHVVINDITDGAHFSSNTNSGLDVGEQSFEMQAGDRFGFILVPNGKMASVVANPEIGGAVRPLFSLATANPEDAYHVGQIADIFGDGSTFVFEDVRVDHVSDHDYNDLVFHVKGAEGQAPTFDQLIADGLLDPDKDFRHTEIGQQIASNVESYIADGKTFPGDPIHPEVPTPPIPHTNVDQGGNGFSGVIGTSVAPNQGGALPDLPTFIKPSLTQDVIDQVGGGDLADIYRVSGQNLTGTEISVLSGSATVSLMTPQGEILSQQIFNHGTHTLDLPTDVSGDVLLKFSSTNGSDATYILQGFASQAKEPFNIGLEFASGITASQQAIIREAANTVQSMIGQGLPSAIVDGKIIDDINFKISATNLDGSGGTLAQTKIDFMRYGSLLPAQSITHFDLSDLAKLEQSGQLADVVTHELLHGLGFGNLWEAKGLVDYANTPLAQYNGQNAIDAFKALGGLTDAISLETDGDGSAGLHWHEGLFQDEIMTADLGGGIGNVAISAVTLASLADLGYIVNRSKATPEYRLFGGQEFSGDDLTPDQIEAFRQLAEMSFEESDPDADYEYIAPIMPTVDPDKIAPEIWAHAERAPNGEYYDWVRYQVKWGDTLSQIALDTMGSGHPDYYWWIANHNGIPNADWIYKYDWIDIPRHRPNYEWEQEQERLKREAELKAQQEREAQAQREREAQLARDKAEQERKAREEAERQAEAERLAAELAEQERRLREELERKHQEEERRKEEERLRELERQREIARQEGKGGQDWFFATPLPEFGPVDPFETKLSGETVGNLVPDDYYRFTLSRKGRIDARLMNLLADADLVLYDARNRPISYSMREGITDEQILVDLIPGTYLLRVNSPKGVTTDYELIVKFKHLLSRTEQGPPPGWTVGGGTGGGATGPLFSDPRIQRIYDTALKNFADPARAKANAQIAQLEAEKRSYQQQMQALLDQMNREQRDKVHQALDGARHEANVRVDNIANPIKNTVDRLADGINNKADSVANGLIRKVDDIWDFGNGWIKDRKEDARKLIRQGRDAVKSAVNNARSWLKVELGRIQDGVKSAIWHFFEAIKNGYRTGAEVNQLIANAANTFRNAVNNAVQNANELVGKFKGQVLSAVDWTKNLGIKIDKYGVKFEFNAYNQVVEPAVNAISGVVSSTINGIGDTLKGITNWLEPRTQQVVADVVNALFGDKTGYLWNQINGVDAKIAATRTGLEKAIQDQSNFYKRLLDDFINGLGSASNFVVGALMGEFNEDPSIWQVLLDSVIGMIPIAGEIGDVRDLIAYTKRFIENPSEMQDAWNWVGVVGSLVGLIPVAGGAIKGVTKIARNADFVTEIKKLGPIIVDAVVDFVKRTDWNSLAVKSRNFYLNILDTVEGLLRKLNDGIRSFDSLLPKLGILQPKYAGIGKLPDEGFFADLADNIYRLQREAPKKIDEGFAFLKGKLDDLITSISPRLIVGNSTKLGNNLDFPTAVIPGTSLKYPGVRGDYQAHHVIPIEVANNSELMLNAVHFGKFDIDSSLNGIFLPSTETNALKLFESTDVALPIHLGSHPIYSSKIQQFLDQEWQDLITLGKTEDSDALLFSVKRIADWAKKGLVEGYLVNDPTIKYLNTP